MNCFKHSPAPAVGLCKTCFKAVCPECAVDVGNGLACKGACEAKVLELNEMWDRSAKIYGIGAYKSRMPSTGVLLWLLLSLVMWGTAAVSYFLKDEIDTASIVTAVIFTIALGLVYWSSRRTGLKC